ncbi:hypothetical protein EON65_54315, partial [archaeon]
MPIVIKRIIPDPDALSDGRKKELAAVLRKAWSTIRVEDRDEDFGDQGLLESLVALVHRTQSFCTFDTDAIYADHYPLMQPPRDASKEVKAAYIQRKDARKRNILYLATELLKTCHPGLVAIVDQEVTTDVIKEVFSAVPT